MTADLLGPALLDRLRPEVQRPGYDRAALRPGMAHIGVGAFHRAHQAEYTDDMLARRFDRWGVVGVNIRPALPRRHARPPRRPLHAPLRSGQTVEARVIGSILRTVDSQSGPDPRSPSSPIPRFDVITMTVTEKAYCHRPADGALDPEHPDIAHDLAHPETPRSLPGIILRALELRMQTHGRPMTRDELRQHPRQRHHPRWRGARPRRDPAAARRLDRRQRWLSLDDGGPHRPGDDTRRPRDGGAALRIPGSRGRGRRAVPPMGHRNPLRRPFPPLGSRRRQLRRGRHPVRAPEDAHPQRRADHARQPRRAGRP